MHDLDKSALTFRYGIDKNNEPPKLPEGLYDPEKIRDVMTGQPSGYETEKPQFKMLKSGQNQQ